ncbi:MAG: copper-binding protein [Verrucomicrobiota bacterium]
MKQWSFLLWLLVAVDCSLAAPAAEVKFYAAHGMVQDVSADRRQVTIHNQDIPGYMKEMTMDYSVKDTNDLTGISAGDEINFTLAVGENESWVKNVQLITHHVAAVTNNTFVFDADSSELKPGDLLPDGTLVTETGSEIHFSDFRGRALAFTFFFTRCPLPDFCARMNRNFAETRQLLLSDASAPTNWQFLSISFDPDSDQPEVLSGYAGLYRGDDARHWLFASASTNTLASLAPRLDLMVVHQGANISHNMRTVVLDPQGRIASQFDGNNWTPEQLADAIVQAARKTP